MMQWSYDTLLKWGTDELTAHDVENAALDAWYLLEHIYGISRDGEKHCLSGVDPTEKRRVSGAIPDG